MKNFYQMNMEEMQRTADKRKPPTKEQKPKLAGKWGTVVSKLNQKNILNTTVRTKERKST
jgi:hypothetical protein